MLLFLIFLLGFMVYAISDICDRPFITMTLGVLLAWLNIFVIAILTYCVYNVLLTLGKR